MIPVHRFEKPKSRLLSRASALVIAASLAAGPALANPSGGRVVAGGAAIAGQGSAEVTVTQRSDRAIIEWDSFSIAAGERTVFRQPNADAIAANRVVGADPSIILGTLEANGQVVLINRNGVLFGESARVDAAGLVATTHDLDNGAFMAGGPIRFDTPGAAGASVVNEGLITIREAGVAALVAPHVRNSGVILADLGRVSLGAGEGFTLDLYGDGLIKFAAGDEIVETLTAPDGTPLKALVENEGEIAADGGRVLLTAAAAREVVNQSVNISGIVRAQTVRRANGVIRLAGPGAVAVETGAVLSASGERGGGRIEVEAGSFASDGLILADGVNENGAAREAGGDIAIEADAVSLGGYVSASGKSGGAVSVKAAGRLSLAETVKAVGALGEGGTITYTAERVMETSTGSTDASGLTHGGTITVKAETQVATSGFYAADGLYGEGGRIDMTAGDVRLLSATLNARGRIRGGRVRVGGAFQGGKTPDPVQAYYDSFVARWEDAAGLDSARATFVNDASVIDVSSHWGAGGTAVIWADEQTTFLGAVDARGEAGGGSVEISAAEDLRRASLDRVTVGAGGHLLIDPKNIIIADQPAVISNWAYAGIIGLGYLPETDAPGLETVDIFGGSVALNAAGDRLAVGARLDDGADNGTQDAGAVYLFSFTDGNFSGGALEGVIGLGYTGGKNVNVAALESNDQFGYGVSLNAAGDRLAVGAPLDHGAGNGTSDSGAVYLFSFTDASFSGGVLEATMGAGYTVGKNVDVVELEDGDRFGWSVSLNAVGDRLAVGALHDAGAGNATIFSGAVYLFSFTDGDFSGGVRESVIGRGYTGGKNINAATVEIRDRFGSDVSLNAAGDRLAVGARDDAGAGNGTLEVGAVYLYSFTDGNFSGGVREATIGDGYTGGKDVDLPALDADDAFGWSVSLNAAGDRLAVGADEDDGVGNTANAAGAVYLFSFTDTSFSGAVLEATIGAGYSGGKDIDVARLETLDLFGSSVSLNAAGDRLAIGARGDDGAGNGVAAAGGVYLISFADTSFSGGVFEGIVGLDYIGEANVDVGTLDNSDRFGTGVALNALGDRLAVGAQSDDGVANGTTDAGAVYLFSFTDTAFSGGVLEAVIGDGYTGGKNVDVPALGASDFFGRSVSLNAAGDRLAVGARGDDGAGDGDNDAGAVYLFSFTDTDFSSGFLEATIGAGYTGGKNFDVTALGAGDNFGRSVSLNAAGDRLAVGAHTDDGAGDNRTDTGAVRLFSFTDTSFSGAVLEATIGDGYTGGKDFNLTALDSLDNFGGSVSLNAAGDRLAAGAFNDGGVSNGATSPGAVYLFSFTDTAFSGAALEATVGDGYSSGKDVDVTALAAADFFGISVSLNAAGDRLAVGATGDDGAGGGAASAGAAYLISFTDRSFSGGAVESVFGAGYSGADDVDVTILEASDEFGTDVSLNAAGDRLAVGTAGDDGADNRGNLNGGVYLFTADRTGGSDLGSAQSFASAPGATVFVAPQDIAAQLAAGTAVTLQASNDITVTDAVAVTGAPGSVGALTLQAGRSVLVNADITTAGGDVTLIANETLANGVIDADRDPGAAVIAMAAGAHIDAGAGRVLLELRDGDGKTNAGSSLITLDSITADTIAVVNDGPTAGSGVAINTGAVLTASAASGDAIVIAGDTFANNAGAGALSTTGAGRYLVYSEDPTADNRGGLAFDFKQYDAAFGDPVLGDADENGFLYTIAPVITAGLTGSVSKTYDATDAASLGPANYTVSGEIDGDIVTLNNPAAGVYDDKNAGAGKTVTANGIAIASATDGAARVFGYQLASTSASAAIGEIERATVTIDGVTVDNKVYDGTTAADLGGTGALDGVLGGDDLSLNASGASAVFADRNAGTGKAATASGFALSGADAGNYDLVQPTGLTADITPAIVTVDLIGAVLKQYDATVAATLAAGNYDMQGVLGADDVVLNNPAAGLYDTKNAGTGKTVSVTGLALSGADAGNYQLASTSVNGAVGEITRATVTISGLIVNDKVYDGTTAATFAGGALDGVIGGDSVNLDDSAASAVFADKNVGTGKAATASGFALSGADAGNYDLTQPTGLAADITRATVTIIGLTVDDKVYDGTTAATFAGGALDGAAGGDDLSLNASGGSVVFADRNAGADKAATGSGFALSGADAGNYTLVQPTGLTADITPAIVTVDLIGAVLKQYDATTDAVLSAGNYQATGFIGGDDAALNNPAAGAYGDKNVGTGKLVTVSGLALTGADAGNYQLASTSASASIGEITRAPVTINGLIIDDKDYDASTSATFSGGAVDGVFGGDNVNIDDSLASAVFADKNAGTGKAVTVSGFALAGVDANNYDLTQPTGLTADIRRAVLTISGVTVQSRVYNAATDATLGGSWVLEGVQSGDDAALDSGAVVNGFFADKNVGTGKAVTVSGFALTGVDANNYDLTQPTGLTADITPATVTIAGNFTAFDKTYDGTMLALIDTSGLTLMGVLSGDDASLDTAGATGSFTDKNVGTGKTVSLSVSGALTGADAMNYILAPGAPTSMASISRAIVTVDLIGAVVKQYDATVDATLAAGNYQATGFVGGDDIALNNPAAGTYSDRNAGTGKLVTVSGLALTGADAGNYQLASTSASASIGEITQAIVTVELIGPVVKTYDAGLGASLSAGNYRVTGILGADILELTNFANGAYSDKNVGTGKTVRVTGLALAGADAGNYQLQSSETSAAVGEIRPAELSILGTFRALNREYDGTRRASVDAAGLSLSGVLGGDAVGILTSEATGAFADRNVGTGKTVSLDTSGLLTGADAGNYVLAGDAPTATADITPATLTVVVDDAEREENEPNPPFTFSISGFVPGEDESLVSGVAANTSASAASPPGDYAIVASGGVADNYVFAYRNGVLRVTPSATEITSSDPVNDQVFRAPSAIQADAVGARQLSLTEGPLFDAMTGATFASVVNAGEADAFASGAGAGEATAAAFENRSRSGASSAPGGERAYWTGAQTDEEEFAYRRIQPKINVNVRYTQKIIYVGRPE